MATAKVNGVRLFYELNGTGEVPLVLVHKIFGLAQRLGPMAEDQGIESELFSDLPEARQWLLAGNSPKRMPSPAKVGATAWPR